MEPLKQWNTRRNHFVLSVKGEYVCVVIVEGERQVEEYRNLGVFSAENIPYILLTCL